MNYDLIAADEQTITRARELAITPITLQETNNNHQEATNNHTQLVLTTSNKREAIEKPIDAVIGAELSKREDFLHHRRSGLDQVKAQLLKEQGAAIILTIQAIKHAPNKAHVLGRMQQNARIAHKLGVDVILASAARTPEDVISAHDQEAFWRAMKIPRPIIEKNQQTITNWLAQAAHRASDQYIAEGIKKTT